MENLLRDNRLVLMEAAVVERLRRNPDVQLDPYLLNSPLIYDSSGRKQLEAIYQQYIDTSIQADLPFLMCTPTWRANKSRVTQTNSPVSINQDATDFMLQLRQHQGPYAERIKIGGLLGCKHDCYRPDEGLDARQAETFHRWQVESLARGGVDFLVAQTLPNVQEALGIARAMQTTALPYIISFVITRDGSVMDGYSLQDAIKLIDNETDQAPIGYMVNCAYPSFLNARQQPEEVFRRLIGFQANASSLDHCELDNAVTLQTEAIPAWGDLMLEMNSRYGIKILGGCCGTGNEHLSYLAMHTANGETSQV